MHDVVSIGRTVDVNGAKAINGSEGKNLLSALTAFVKVVVDLPPDGQSSKGEAIHLMDTYQSI